MGYLNLVGSFVYKEPVFRSKLDALAQNDAQLKTDGWAASTKVVFYQTAVPVGWTQDASQNDKALRVVSGAGAGSGGSHALSAAITLAHTHAISSDDGHTHAYAAHTHSFGGGTGGTNIGNAVSLYIGGGLLQRRVAGSGTINALKALLTAPGTITLGTQSAHDHGGASSSALTDVALAYADVIIGTRDALSGTYTDLTSYWHTGDKIDFDPFQSLANNDAYLYGALMPAATVSLFAQNAAPTGWTKVSGPDDRFLRVVSGAGAGVGGSSPISNGLSLSHTHTLTAVADHTHTMPAHTHPMASTVSAPGWQAPADVAAYYVQADGSGNLVTSSDASSPSSRTVYQDSSANDGSGNTTAAGGHTHTLPAQLATFFFSYVDVIQCSKDSTGAPYSYTDMTSTFVWKGLVSKQKLNALAQNDAYVQYHITPTNTAMLFFMASPPTGWVKQLAHDDIGIRIVSGSSGGIVGGGAQGLSQTIPLQHAHTIGAAGSHTHDPSHVHAIASTTQTANAPTSTVVESRASSVMGSGHTGGNISASSTLKNVSQIPLEIITNGPNALLTADPDHNHGGVTDTKLSDVQLAYADVIWCTKS